MSKQNEEKATLHIRDISPAMASEIQKFAKKQMGNTGRLSLEIDNEPVYILRDEYVKVSDCCTDIYNIIYSEDIESMGDEVTKISEAKRDLKEMNRIYNKLPKLVNKLGAAIGSFAAGLEKLKEQKNA